MKRILLTFTIHANYRDSSYYDLKNDKFLKDKSLEDIEEQIALWLLMYEHPNVQLEIVHVDKAAEFAGEDDDEHSMEAT